jgi:hypothetical protein
VRLGTEVTLLSAYLCFSQPRFKRAQSAVRVVTAAARARRPFAAKRRMLRYMYTAVQLTTVSFFDGESENQEGKSSGGAE